MNRIAVAATLWLLPLPLCAQWLNLPTPGIPRTADVVAVLYEGGTGRHRQIYVDGRQLPKDPNPT